jgi:two-component system sensor histidine kinase GlrK
MRVRYPKSFLALLFVGLTLVALPLIFALVNNAVAIDRLTNQGQKAVYEATRLIQESRALSESVTGMERVARQYLVLRDRSLLDGYGNLREGFLRSARLLQHSRLAEEQRALLAEMVEREEAIHRQLAALSPANPEAPAKDQEAQQVQWIAVAFESLSQGAQKLVIHSNDVIDREVETLRQMSQKAYEIMMLQMLALVPVAIFLVVGFPLLIVPPIRQLAQGIRTLGEGRFDLEIRVDGPQDLRYLGQQLDWLRLRLMELEEQKKKFLSHVSHELKTPLTALREGSDLLADEVVGKLNPEQKEIARILRQSSLQLGRLIEDLLAYSASQFRKGKLNIKQVKMSDVVKSVVNDHKLALRARSIQLELDCEAVYVSGDEEKLRTVVDNLVSNAIKFTPEGGRVRIELHRDEDAAVLDVIDDGPGIPPEERERVFAPFFQGRAQQSAAVKGSGLGLSIVKEHVLAHGGQVEVVDRAAPGAHFRVTLPLNPWVGA